MDTHSSSLRRPIHIGALSLEGNIFLAPVAGYSDRAFRSLCVEQGADITFTELVSSEALSRNSFRYEDYDKKDKNGRMNPTLALLRHADNERFYAIQLFGANPNSMYQAAALLAPWKPSLVDINAGCPVQKVVKTGAGSALMKDPALLARVTEAVVRASEAYLGSVPVSVKMRSGWDTQSLNYRECARAVLDAGAAMISLHPRTRSQMYSGVSNWSHIADLTSCVSVPVAGSGDLFSPEDARRMLAETGCAAVMFARGAMGDPFIFANTRRLLETGSYTPPDPAEKIAAGFRQLELLAHDIGESAACREMRKHFCAYTKGAAGGAELRNRLVHAVSITEYADIIAAGNRVGIGNIIK